MASSGSPGRAAVPAGPNTAPDVPADSGASYDAYDLAFRRWPPTNMTPDEQERAVQIFLRERAMWERLKGLDGDVEIHAYVIEDGQEKEVSSVRGRIHVEPTEPDEEAIKQKRMASYYKVCLADPEGRWKCSSDGRLPGTQFSGPNDVMPETLLAWLNSPAIPDALSIPKMSLLHGPTDAASASKYFSSERALWKVPQAEDVHDSFMYKHEEGYKHYTTKVFEQGHFGVYEKTEDGETSARVEFKEYRGNNEQETFPTEITVYYKGVQKLKLTLSNLALDFK